MREQLELFGMLCLLGMGAAGTYDGLRLIRRQRPCGLFRVSVEDALFWLALAAGTFGIFYEKNSGNLRFYGFIGIFLGGILYEISAGRLIFKKAEEALTRRRQNHPAKKRRNFFRPIDE